MASRTFADEHGREWIVLEVSPTWTERRLRPDRRTHDIGPKPGQPERRKGEDRRRGRSEAGPRVKINPGLAGGWLAFESKRDRRRLSPVPAGWFEATEAELQRMLALATEVPGRRNRLIE